MPSAAPSPPDDAGSADAPGAGATARLAEARRGRLLRLAETMSGVGHWWLDARTGAVEWSDAVYRIHGCNPDSFSPQLDDALAFYGEDGRRRVESHLAAALQDGAGFAFELDLRRRDGIVRRVACRAACERDGSGAVVAVAGVFQDVTAQADLLAEVTRERERYKLLTETATDVIATYGPDAVFTYISPAVERILGHPPESVVGRRTYELIHPADHARVAAEFQALLAGGASSARIEYRALTATGDPLWVEAHPTPVRDEAGRLTGFQDVVRDISARRAAQEAAEAATAKAQAGEARLRHIAANATDMIATTALDSTILFVTPAVHRILGYTAEEMLGRRTVDFTHPDDLPHVLELFGRLVAAGPSAQVAPYQFRGRRRDGRWVWLEGQPRVEFDAEGRPLVFQDVVRDITAHKALEAELTAARQEAELAAQAKADFLANMSHELRTPLTSILGFTELASGQADLAPTTRDHLRRIQTASRALLSTVNDLLDFSKLEAGAIVLKPAPTDLAAVCRDAVELFAQPAAAKGLRLEAVTDGPSPDAVLIDPDRLLQLLINLVGNAVKFTEAGSVVVAASVAGGRARIEVRDTGPGVAPEAMDRLFKRFSQVDGSSTRAHGGTGLGLAICAALAESMGGSVSATSRLGEGSTFTLDLAAPPATLAFPEGVSAGPPRLEALRILVVDDVDVNRELTRLMLAGAGAEVTGAASGEEALALLAEQPVDVVLMDMRMPGLDGPAVLERLRATPGPNDQTPVVAYTAEHPQPEARRGFAGVVHKPVRLEALIAAILAAFEDEAPIMEVRAHG